MILLLKVLFWVNILFKVIFWGLFWVGLLFWGLFWVTFLLQTLFWVNLLKKLLKKVLKKVLKERSPQKSTQKSPFILLFWIQNLYRITAVFVLLTTSIFPNFCKIVFLYPVNLHFTAHSILHSTAPIVWLTTSIFPDCCKIIFLPWAVFHSTVNQCILNSYAMITHYHYERLGYFDDQQVLYDEHSGDYQDVFDARATWFRSFILMPCFIQSIPRYTRVVTIQCRHYIG